MGLGQTIAPQGIRKYLPILSWLPNYQSQWLRADLLAGLVAAAIFANAPRVREKALALIQQEQPRVIAVDCSAVPDIEYTALKHLTELEERLRAAGIMLWLVALNPEPLRVVERSALGAVLGHERIFVNLKQAADAYLGLQPGGYRP
jgi:MFS superfamily sulfate permease-like transporter